jgi:hypothetical protein
MYGTAMYGTAPPPRRGALLEMCIALYRLHRLNTAGRCAVCRIPGDCAPRRGCVKILRAAQLDPTRFDVSAARSRFN